jgi:hypothetical protein
MISKPRRASKSKRFSENFIIDYRLISFEPPHNHERYNFDLERKKFIIFSTVRCSNTINHDARHVGRQMYTAQGKWEKWNDKVHKTFRPIIRYLICPFLLYFAKNEILIRVFNLLVDVHVIPSRVLTVAQHNSLCNMEEKSCCKVESMPVLKIWAVRCFNSLLGIQYSPLLFLPRSTNNQFIGLSVTSGK